VRYWLCTLLGLLICGAALVGVTWGIYHLIRTGTCASGGPYVSARPCPPGTGGHIGALIGGIFGSLVGMGIYAARGGGSVASGTVGLGLVMWALLFVLLAAGAMVGAFGPGADDRADSQTAAVILGVIFVPMGVAPLLLALFGRRFRPKSG
jgi:hypothetical protein